MDRDDATRLQPQDDATRLQPEAEDATRLAPTAPPDAAARRVAEADVPLEWHKGDVILDLYEVKQVFTSGGMGLVYRVHHRNWNIDLAVKSPRPEYFQTQTHKETFIREAETWVDLGLHPHTVSCYYVRTLGGIPRVFAEYVEGGSLSDWIRKRRLYEDGPEKALERILDVAIQFAWGLHYAHEQGLMHQDVKPANVMMTPDGVVKVTDFGLAKARSVAGEAVGGGEGRSILVSSGGMTPAYCSPEQAAGERLTYRTDIWSWGVSVLEMFVGEVTWLAGQAAAEALEGYLEMGPEDESIPAIPAGVAELLGHCFQQNPIHRPGSMANVAAALQETYQHEVGQPYPRQMPKAVELRADSLNNRALSLLDLGREEAAEAAWEAALEADPHHAEATYNLGLIKWRSVQTTDIPLIEKLRGVCASHPGEWLPLYLLGQVHLERGDCQAALETLGKTEGPGASRDEVVSSLTLAEHWLGDSRRLLHTFEGHTLNVTSVCLSADGRCALSGSGSSLVAAGDNVLKLWDASSGKCLRTFEGHTDPVFSVCLSADGHYALSGSADKTLKLWEVSSGKYLRTFEGHTSNVKSVCLSTDGRYALSGSNDKTIKLWEVSSGKCLRTFEGHAKYVTSVCLSADGRCALSGGYDKTLKLWEVSSGKCLRTFEGHTEYVTSVCLSADGRYALSGSGSFLVAADDNVLKLWDASSGKCLCTIEGHTAPVFSVCLSADGRYALSGSADKTLKLWEVSSGKCLRTFEGHTASVFSVCLSADGHYALSGSGDKTLKLWEMDWDADAFAAPMKLSRVLASETALAGQAAYEQAMARAREAFRQGEALVAARHIRLARSQPGYRRSPEALREWSRLYPRLARKSLHAGWESATFQGHTDSVWSVCLSVDGHYALSGSSDKTLKLWDVASSECLRTFEGHTSDVTSVCLITDGCYALSGSFDKTLKLWDVASSECLRTFEGHTDAVFSVFVSADGRYALSGGSDKTLKLWEVSSGKCLRTFEGHTKSVFSACLSADGRYALSGSGDKTLRLWEVESGECLRTFKGHMWDVSSVCLSADGRYALSGSGISKTLRLWDLESGACLCTFEGYTSHVKSVCLSADGHYALSGSIDKMIKLWEVTSGQCMRTFEGHTGFVQSVCLSADGRYALSGSSDNTLKLWELDWELENNQPAGWDEGARPYLEMFLSAHTPYVGVLPRDRDPTEREITLALTRRGKPVWTEEDFQQLLYTLGCAGYGWLRLEGVRQKLEEMAAARQ